MDKDKTTKQELSIYKKRSKELLDALDNIYAEIGKYQKTTKSLSAAEDKFEAASSNIEKLTSNIQKVIVSIEEYISGLYNLSTEETIEKISFLHSDTEILKAKSAELQTILDDLRAVSTAISNYEKTAASLKVGISSLEKSLAKIYDAISKNDKNLESNSAKLTALEKRLDKLEGLLSDVYSSEQKVRDDNSELRDQIARLLKKMSEEPENKPKKGLFGRK